MTLTPTEIQSHNALYRRAYSLIRPHIFIGGESRSARPGWFARRSLKKGIALFQCALGINPNSWQSRFWIAKALQRLGEHQESMSWFADALRLDEANEGIAKEAGVEALEVGDYKLALAIVRPAAERNPDDAALQHNLGLALLLCGRVAEAHQAFNRAAAHHSDSVTSRLVTLTELVLRGERLCPRRLTDIQQNV